MTVDLRRYRDKPHGTKKQFSCFAWVPSAAERHVWCKYTRRGFSGQIQTLYPFKDFSVCVEKNLARHSYFISAPFFLLGTNLLYDTAGDEVEGKGAAGLVVAGAAVTGGAPSPTPISHPTTQGALSVLDSYMHAKCFRIIREIVSRIKLGPQNIKLRDLRVWNLQECHQVLFNSVPRLKKRPPRSDFIWYLVIGDWAHVLLAQVSHVFE